MKVAVVGGTGRGVLGKPLVAALAARGDEVLALSRKPGRTMPKGVSHQRVDLITGDGLAEALAGVEVIVDASNSSTPRHAAPVLVEGTKRLLRAGAEAGARHYVGVSIVGCERVPMAELAKAWRRADHRALPLRFPIIGPIGRPLREGALCNPDAAAGGRTFEQWLTDA